MALLIFNWLTGAAAWFWLIRRYDRIDPEPYRAMLSVGILGGILYYFNMRYSIEPKHKNCSFVANKITDVIAFIVGFILIFKL